MDLPSQHPTLALHLTDLTLTPLITSSSSRSHLHALSSLASSALTASNTVQRVRLGRPQRIMVEYPARGAVFLQSFLHPENDLPTTTATTTTTTTTTSTSATATNTNHGDENEGGENEVEGDDAVPVLVGLVVAGSRDDVREARRAAARLERVGREFQRQWAAQAGTDAQEA